MANKIKINNIYKQVNECNIEELRFYIDSMLEKRKKNFSDFYKKISSCKKK